MPEKMECIQTCPHPPQLEPLVPECYCSSNVESEGAGVNGGLECMLITRPWDFCKAAYHPPL